MSSILLLSLLQDCANKKMKNRGGPVFAYSSSSDDDDDYVPDASGDDDDDDHDHDKARKGAKGAPAAEARPVARRVAHKALAKLRGGCIGEEEERYLKRLSRTECGRFTGIARDVMRRVRNKTPLLYRLLDWPVSARTKAVICERLSRFDLMEPGEGEHAKLAAWVAGIEKLPIGTHCALPVDVRADPPEKVGAFLQDARAALDAAVYGHEAAKDDIVRLCAQWIRNPAAPLQALALQGPMGVGKTTLVKNGIARAMGRPFQFVPLGGAQDASFLQGFEYTYEGARPGRIADAIKDAGVMNPVLFFDELDKVSDTPRGREIQQILVHLLDRTQNTQFRDRYFAGIDLDLSRAVFVVSYNDPSKIDPILLDRMRVVETRGFSADQKLKITRQFVLPEAIQQIGLPAGSVTIDDGAIKHLIANYTKREKGVRCLQRCVHQIVSEVNLRRLLGKLPEDAPTHVTQETVGGYVKSLRTGGANASLSQMYM